jgi:tRNA threonylcarbamoyladenosine biosynthesis protein TsaB
MPLVEQALSAAGLAPNQADVFAVDIGPGSFTGVRIGVSTVKAFAYGLSKPVMGVNTLDALAYNVVAHKGTICAMMDARRAQVYAAQYRSDGKSLSRIGDYEALSAEACTSRWAGQEGILLVGDGAQANRALLTEKGQGVRFAPPHLIRQRAAAAGALAMNRLSDGAQLQSPFSLEPIYLRLPQAEREYQRKQRENLG